MTSDVGYLRIATEEAFAPPELISMWQSMLADGTCDDPGFISLPGFYLRSKAERPAAILARLQDLGERRIADMDAAGVDRQIISLTCPGTQILDRDRAVAMAALANDQLAEACRRYPDRFSGLTAVAPQDPADAAIQIERGARELGLVGVIINSHTQGEYLDDPKFWPIFEAAEALDTPVYLHPNTPPRNMIGPMLEAGLDSAIYGFAVETGLHLLRIITAGVFDRFPRLRIVVGHLRRSDDAGPAPARPRRQEGLLPGHRGARLRPVTRSPRPVPPRSPQARTARSPHARTARSPQARTARPPRPVRPAHPGPYGPLTPRSPRAL